MQPQELVRQLSVAFQRCTDLRVPHCPHAEAVQVEKRLAVRPAVVHDLRVVRLVRQIRDTGQGFTSWRHVPATARTRALRQASGAERRAAPL